MESNQTKFSYEKPFFEEVAQVPGDLSETQVPPAQTGIKAWVRAHLLLSTVLITLLIVVLVGGMAALLLQPRSKELQPQNSGTVTTPPVPLSPLEQKILDIRTELDSADPTRGQEPFPPIDMDIRLDESQR